MFKQLTIDDYSQYETIDSDYEDGDVIVEGDDCFTTEVNTEVKTISKEVRQLDLKDVHVAASDDEEQVTYDDNVNTESDSDRHSEAENEIDEGQRTNKFVINLGKKIFRMEIQVLFFTEK